MDAITPRPVVPHEPAAPQRKVTGKVRVAIDLMVQRGLKRDDAAQQAGLKDNSLYVALRRPEVKAYYLDQCEVLRLSLRARGIHRMGEVMEQSDNLNASVGAYKALRDDGSDVSRMNAGLTQTPGFAIVILQPVPSPAAITGHERVIEQKPNDINGSGSHQLERPTDAIGRPR